MWKRKELKKKARTMLRSQYFIMIAVCFILAFVAGEYGDSLMSITYYDVSQEVESVETAKIHEGRTELDLSEEESAESEQSFSNPHGEKVVEPNSRGIFAKIFRNVNAKGSFFLGIAHTLLPLINNSEAAQIFISVLGIAFSFFWWFFIQNLLMVGEKRFFLEKIHYTDVPFRTLLMPICTGEGLNVAAAMALKSLYQFLWWLTIAGGVIKYYSYLMVPYILAENPAVKPKEAVALSRKMMEGEKFRAFLLDCSFLGWRILGTFTLGILDIFFVNPYAASAKAQLYRELRKKVLERKIAGYEYLNDKWLFEIPEEMRRVPEEKYAYPTGYFPIQEPKHRVLLHTDYMRKYSLRTLVLLFFSFSIIGWLWEVGLHVVQDGTFVNRGTMYGPWLPIYGTGGVLVLVLLKKVRKNPILTFFLTVLICGVLEYWTSWALEAAKDTKWWDYSGYFLNLHGRICAEGLFVFGLGGCAIIYIVAPVLAELYDRIPVYRQTLLCMMLVAAFAADLSYASMYPNKGRGITDYDTRASLEEHTWQEKEWQEYAACRPIYPGKIRM